MTCSCLSWYFSRGLFCVYHTKYHPFGMHHSLLCFILFCSEAKRVISKCYNSLCLNTISFFTINLTCVQWATSIIAQQKQKYQSEWLLIYHKNLKWAIFSSIWVIKYEIMRFFFLLSTNSMWTALCYIQSEHHCPSRLDPNNDNYCYTLSE